MNHDSAPPPPPPGPGPSSVGRWAVAVVGMVVIGVVAYLVGSSGSDDSAAPTSVVEAGSTTAGAETPSDVTESTIEAEDESTEIGVLGLTSLVIDDGLRVSWQPVADAAGYEFDCSSGETGHIPADSVWFETDIACESSVRCAVTAVDDEDQPLARGEVTEVGSGCSVDPPVEEPIEQPVVDLNLWTENDPDGDWVVRFGWDDVAGAESYQATIQYSSVALEVSNSFGSTLPEGTTGTEFDVPCGARGTFSIAAKGSNGADITTALIDFSAEGCGTGVAVGGLAFPRKEDTLTSGIRSTVVECPASTHLLAGGFVLVTYEDLAGTERTYVLGNRPSGNGWEVTLAVPPGRQMKVEVSAICVKGDWQTSSVSQRLQVSSGTPGAVTATCPAGTLRTAGGWWANPFLDLVSSVPAENGWQVSVEGEAVGGAGPIFAYAVCIEHPGLIATLVSSRASIADGERSRSLSEWCPEGALASGGGFASTGGVITGSERGAGAVPVTWATTIANWVTPGDAGPAISAHLSAICLAPG